MNEHFLHNFSHRMKHMAYSTMFIRNFQSRNVSFKKINDMGFDIDDAINISMMSLSFIMENELKDSCCTFSNLSDFIYDTVNESDFIDIQISHENAVMLTKILINEIFMNNGELMKFKYYDFVKKKINYYPVSYIYYPKNGVPSYKLTEYGMNFMLSTCEFEENLGIEVNTLVLRLHMEKQDYSGMLSDLKNIYVRAYGIMNAIDNKISGIRYNVSIYNEKDIQDFVDKGNNIINETIPKIKSYRKELNIIFENMSNSENEIDNDKIRIVSEIKYRFDSLIDLFFRILGKTNQLVDIYDKQLDLFYSYYDSELDFRKEIYDVVSVNINQLYNFYNLISNFFFCKKEKSLINLNNIDYCKNFENDNKINERKYFNKELAKEQLIKIKEENNAKHKYMWALFLQGLKSNNNILKLSDIKIFIDKYNTWKESIAATPDILKEFIEALKYIGTIDIDDEREEYNIRNKNNVLAEGMVDVLIDILMNVNLSDDDNSYYKRLKVIFDSNNSVVFKTFESNPDNVLHIVSDDLIIKGE